MSNPAIPRADVHRLAEACSDEAEAFRSVATRLIRDQKPLANFIQANAAHMQGASGEVALYMFSVVLRILEQSGGRLKKVPKRDALRASGRIKEIVPQLMPFDAELPSRVRAIEWRAQPHVLDECLWALYERDDIQEGEVDVDPDQSALIFLVLWAVVESLDAHWRPPKGFAEAVAAAEAAAAEAGEE